MTKGLTSIVVLIGIGAVLCQLEDSQKPVVIRLEAQPKKANFMNTMETPRALMPTNTRVQGTPTTRIQAAPTSEFVAPGPRMTSVAGAPQIPPAAIPQPNIFGGALPPAPPSAQQPNMGFGASPGTLTFVPRTIVTPPPPPPVEIPADVQNQLIKFFGLDSFGIPGLTGNHPNGLAGAVQELRAAGIPVQALPAEHVPGNVPITQPKSDILSEANPNFASPINQLMNELKGTGSSNHQGSGAIPLPEATPGENGFIGFLSTSIRKLVKESGVSEVFTQGIPSVIGTGTPTNVGSAKSSFSTDDKLPKEDHDIRRQQSPGQRVMSGLASALGGGGPNSPTHAGLPRIPGIPLLPGGIPRNAQGQIDVVNLIGSITRRVSNGTTLADVIPPEQLQNLADNVTDALLPATPEAFDMGKFMGRWFEGINSPRATEQRCVVHHYGGLTKNDKTATFTALKIYREGSEFGPVRYSIGYAFRGGNKDAMLQLHSSESADAQPFWIYKLGPEGTDPFGNSQYDYAIVSNWVKYPVTVLVRDPDTFKKKHEAEVLKWLEDQGFINGFVRAFNLLQPSEYSPCQYADSTFEVFGK
uniref:Lipocln_cytosolic_FA-bd_dom domain-containing protein n=1 Tax=Rhabditophanes sp. KR3021 TaxID=114890 RepID=A0AC35U5W6_9BILA